MARPHNERSPDVEQYPYSCSWAMGHRILVKIDIDSRIERSRAARLDIKLDFRALRTTEKQVRGKLRYGFLQLAASNEAEVDHDLIYDWLEGLDYDTLPMQYLEMTAPFYPAHAVDLIERLVGIDGEVGLRWESFTLQFPSSDQLAEMIWGSIAPNITNLSRFHLVNIDWADIYWGYADPRVPILSLPRVKDLRMKNLIDWEQFLSFDPSSIQRLAVQLALEEAFFSQLAHFSQLRTLTLSPAVFFEVSKVGTSATNRISIPTLGELVLLGEFHHLDVVTFDLPNLQRIRIESKGSFATQPTIPTIQPLEVHWAAESESDYRNETLMMADETIRALFLCYTSSDRLSVTSFLKENTLKVLNELSKEEALPSGWKTVSFHNTSDDVETMRIGDILSS